MTRKEESSRNDPSEIPCSGGQLNGRVSAPKVVGLGREWELSGGRDSAGLCSLIPRLLHIG